MKLPGFSWISLVYPQCVPQSRVVFSNHCGDGHVWPRVAPGAFLVNCVDYRLALPILHTASTRRADGVGLYGEAGDSYCHI
jgi:hypothetical protein